MSGGGRSLRLLHAFSGLPTSGSEKRAVSHCPRPTPGWDVREGVNGRELLDVGSQETSPVVANARATTRVAGRNHGSHHVPSPC